MITKLPKEFLSVISENNGLKQYLSNLSKGRDFTPRSWLYESMEPKQILDQWLEQLDVLRNGDSFEQKVFQFDTSQIEKWGPQGGIKPIQQLMDVIEPSFAGADSPQPVAFKEHLWEASVAHVSSQMVKHGVRGLRPASYKHVIDDMRARDTLESNSGWPLFTRRNKPEVVSASIAAAEDGEWLDFPAIALFRNYNLKTRLVWMFPMAANLVEGSFFQPLQSAIVKANDPFYSPWLGFETVRRQITEVYGSGRYIAASDFSSTDAHFQLPSSYQVLDVMKVVFQQKYLGALRQSIERMHTIPLIIGLDEMLTGRHGVSSGSNWTNFVETVFDQIFGEYVGRQTNYVGLYAIGDDMAWVADRYSDTFNEQLEELGAKVGQAVKAEKTTNDPDSVKTLQRLFQRGYSRQDGLLRGVYSTVRALKSSVYPERFHKPSSWNSDMFCARQYMILENCVDHPLFEQFVKFVVRGQKDLIPFAQRSAASLDRTLQETKLLPGFNPTYNQEKRDTSLSAFESIRIARSL